MSELKDLGRKLGQAQDALLAQTDYLARGNALLNEALAAPRASRRRVVAWSLAAAAACLVLGLVAALVWSRPALTVLVGDPATPGHAGQWLAAPLDRPIPLRFSDGSTLRLAPGTGARVLELSAKGARVLLEHGRAAMHVVKRSGAAWQLQVGPFDVRVTGTQFEVAWTPEDQAFTLEMAEGQVVVEGPMISAGREVHAGEVLRVWVSEGRVEIAPRDQHPPAAPVVPAAPPVAAPACASVEETPAVVAPPVSEQRAVAAPATATAAPSWQRLAQAGHYDQALAAGEASGFDRLVASLSAEDLALLGDVARLAGDRQRAEQAYLAVRRRFPGSDSASLGAFELGRIAFDRDGDYAKAATWLNRYLEEAAGEGLKRAALGRLIEAYQRAGQPEQAAATARRYLERYPDGPHAHFAAEVLESPAPTAAPSGAAPDSR